MYKIVKLILNFLKTLSCKLGFCCGSKCESSCNPKKEFQEGSIIQVKQQEEKNPYGLTGKGRKKF